MINLQITSKLKRLIVVSLILCHYSLIAQNINHYGVFPTIDHTGVLSDRWSYGLYYFNAFNVVNEKGEGKEDRPGYFVFYAEQSLSYSLNKTLSVTGSYVYERQNPTRENHRNENRFYIQTTWKPEVDKTRLKFRVRFDGRFIQDPVTKERPFTSRVRFLLGGSRDITANKKFYLTAYNEFFFDTYKDAPVTYSENWAYVGIGARTKKAGNWELGPLYICWVTNSDRDLLNFYYLQLSWITTLDFRKPKIK